MKKVMLFKIVVTIIGMFFASVVLASTCPPGMTHYWKFDETGSPTTFFDSYMGTNNATCTDCPAPTTGIINGALQFDGSNDEVNVADDGTFDWGPGDSFSIEYWMNTSESTEGNKVLAGRNDNSPESDLTWWVGCASSGRVLFALRDSDGNLAILNEGDNGPVLNDGVWHHIVAVRDGVLGVNSVYADGELIDSLPYTYTAGFQGSIALNIGYLDLFTHYRYNGTLDEVALWDKALTPEEITAHYTDGLNGTDYCDGVYLCSSDADCDDDNVCTNDSCVDGQCVNQCIADDPIDSCCYNHACTSEPVCDITCPSGMNHYWKFDETGSPTTFLDSYVGTNNATCTDCPTPIEGFHNGALQFDGSNDEVNVADDGTFDWGPGDSFSIEYWMNTSESTEGNKVLAGRNDNSPESDLTWWVGCASSGRVLFALRDSDGNLAILNEGDNGPVLNDGVWHHIVAVRDGVLGVNSVYADGELIDSLPYTYTAGFQGSIALNIGYLDLFTHYRYNGTLDEVALWDKALTPEEITSHYTDGLDGIDYCYGRNCSFDADCDDDNVCTYDYCDKLGEKWECVNQCIADEPIDSCCYNHACTSEPVCDIACPSGMNHYWKFDETGSPTTFFDSYMGTNNATCTDCPAPTTGIINGALQFDGSNDEVNVADDGTFDWGPGDSFSIEYWMNTSESTEGNKVLAGRNDNSPESDLTWWVGCASSGRVLFALRDSDGNLAILNEGDNGPVLNDGVWHHIVAVRDGVLGVNSVYADGELIDSLPYTYTAGFQGSIALNIGYLDLFTHYRYNGTLDEVALWDKALTPEEITSHYYARLNSIDYCELCLTVDDCDDGNVCTDESCVAGQCVYTENTTSCDDSLFCTVFDQCTSGVCGGSARDCSSAGDQCNEGVCDDISDQCVAQPKTDGTPCDDGLFCTENDVCNVGGCIGSPRDCDDGLFCNGNEICNEGTYQCENSGDPCFPSACNESLDVCEGGGDDGDGDGIPDNEDNCADTPNPNQTNSDNDSHGDACDNCSDIDNEDQADSDGDGIGDICELDEGVCIDFDPDTLNISSCGKWVTIYIELPDGYDPADIDPSTILLNDEISPVLDPKYGFVTDEESYLVDKACLPDVIERMVKFDRQTVKAILPVGMEVDVTITGELTDGNYFEGIDVIRVIDRTECKGDVDYDGDVDGTDAEKFKKNYGRNKLYNPCTEENPCEGVDFDCDGQVDGEDAMITKADFGRSAYSRPCPSGL